MLKVIAVLGILAVLAGANVFIASRLLLGLNAVFEGVNTWLFAVVYAFFAVSTIFGYAPHYYKGKKSMNRIGSYWAGVFIYALSFFVIAEGVIRIGRIAGAIPAPVPGTVRAVSAAVVVVLTAGVLLWGRYNASRINLVSYDIKLPGGGRFPLKITYIADLHLGTPASEKNLPRIVREINATRPDIVCLVGDIFNDDINLVRNPAAVKALFASIQSTHGVYACLGNHDSGLTFHEMCRFLADSGVTLLNDAYRVIDNRVVLLGRVDASPLWGFDTLKRAALEALDIPEELPVVVMEHNPMHMGEYGAAYALLLCGHTHKGQMFPGNLLIKALFAVHYGHFQKDANSPHVIITSGVSTWGPPIRVGSRNEIVAVTLTSPCA